jgi:aspartate carbamoyltransferase regulatory subunit
LNVKEISWLRNIKEGTVWEHFSKLIEYNQLSVFDVLPKDKIYKIANNIKSKDDKLKDIKQRLNDDKITYNEVNCVLAMVKLKNK